MTRGRFRGGGLIKNPATAGIQGHRVYRPTMCKKICESATCHKPFVDRSKTHTKRFCSEVCRRHAEAQRRQIKISERRYEAWVKKLVQCEQCGSIFRPGRRGSPSRFCSELCRWKFERPAALARIHERKRLENHDWIPRTGRMTYVCLGCGREFETSVIGRRRKYCSPKCRWEAIRRSLGRLPRIKWLEERRASSPWFECQNPKCKRLFQAIGRSGSMGRVYCSRECYFEHRQEFRGAWRPSRPLELRRDQSARRAKAAGVPIEVGFQAIDICKRDGWRCQKCGCDTPQELRGTNEPNAPEVDHIVPLAKGGPHTKENLQNLCRTCNQAKGDSDDGAFFAQEDLPF